MKHIKCLDGLRGLMALNVVLCHFVCVYYPQMYILGWGKSDCMAFFSETPLNALVNGNIAVQFFFLLSGFLAALSVFSGESTSIAFRGVKRYLRLLPMIAGATFFAYILMKLGLMYHLEICDSANGQFLIEYNNFNPTVRSLLYNVFVRTFIANNEYVGPFWYIKPEFWGYLMAIGICILTKGYRWRRIGYLFVLILLWWNQNLCNYSTFVFGILLADLYFYRDKDTTYFSKYYTDIISRRLFSVLCIVVGSYLAMIPISMSSLYEWLPCVDSGVWQFEELGSRFYRAFGLFLSIWGILNLNKVSKLFDNRVFQWMGKTSFATYAFHWPLMLSLEAYLFSILFDSFSYNIAACGAFLLTLPVIYIVSYMASKYLNKSISVKKISQIFNRMKDSKA